jgi:hypothetical protein
MLTVSDPELRALAEGECVIAFAPRGSVTEGDEVGVASSGPLPAGALKPAYRRWADAGPPEGRWTAVVDSIGPAAKLDPIAGASRFVLTAPGDGDLVVLRVYGEDGPVLSDDAFDARVRSITGALIQ